MKTSLLTLIPLFLLSFGPLKILAQNSSQSLHFAKQESKKIREIAFGKHIRIQTLDGNKIKGVLQNGNQEYIILNTDTILVEQIEWINQRVLLKPVAIAVFAFGTTLFTFGTVAWASSVGSDDVWAQLGAVVGALIGIAGGIIDAATLPVFIKARKYRLHGEKAKWLIIANS